MKTGFAFKTSQGGVVVLVVAAAEPRPGEEYMQQDGPNVAVEASRRVCGRSLCYYLYFVCV